MARILIIEDSRSQAAIMDEIVRNAGHEPILCEDISRGVANLVTSHQPDIVLLDLILLGPDGKPRADGFQVCREIKRLPGTTIKVVVVSAQNDDDATEWALMQGADAFLRKPFAMEDLVNTINHVLTNPDGANNP